jgi:serine/threonine protein kinase/tetratricopeptide (TPR) repeat protein
MTESAESNAAVPLDTSIPADALPLEAILFTEELHRRPSRPPDYEKENRSLEALARALAHSPRTILQILTETILDITQSDSSGVSLLTPDGQRFYWPALAGRWTPHIGGGTPRDWGPCGVVLDRNMPLLMRHPEWRYTYFLPISPPPVETLIVPFYLGGKAVGTIWAVMHDDRSEFDAEDERLMTRLSTFASTAYQTLATIDELRFQISEHEKAERAVKVTACPKCGRPLTQFGPGGECLRCVFDWGFTSEREGSEDAEYRGVEPTPLNYGHFEVEVDADGLPAGLGAGAMAVTYRARDTILNSIVALKVIGRKLAENPTARARFLREARAAAQIQHPNVARVIHYGEQDGECFYAMELVQGETLEALVQRDGPLPLTLALEVMEQTARGLAAGEACGVVHRDLKPSNLMIESDRTGHLIVKIIDYGVAKVMAPDETIQTRAEFIGTPAFASPEQFDETGQQQIDTRSDIYALGVTFWYLLTGRTPFASRSIEEIRTKQTQQLPLEQLKSVHAPAQVVALLKSMLAADPARRPQTARELLSAIHRCYIKFSTEARSRRKRFIRVAAGAILVLGAIAFGTWLYQRVQSSAEIERSIAVLPFENLSPDREDTYFAVGMQGEITGDLARLSGLKVIGSQSTRSYVPGKERNLREIGRELGVRHLLQGTISRDNDQMRVALHLVDLRDSGRPWTGIYERPMKGVFALQSEITQAVAARLKARLSPNETVALNEPLTVDLRAYDLYLQAQAIERLVKDTAEEASVTERRISLLSDAVDRDPKFVLAYCALAKAYDTLYQIKDITPVGERNVDYRAMAGVALEKARRVAPDFGPVHLALADHFVLALNDLEQGRLEIDLARRTMPNAAALETTAASIARRQSRWDDALRAIERSVALEPRATENLFTLANTFRLMRRYDRFESAMTRLLGVLPPDRSATYRVFRTFGPLESEGEIGPLRAAIATVTPEEDASGAIRDLHNLILALWSHDPDSVSRISAQAAETTFVFNGVKYPKSWYEGLAARMRGDKKGAQAAFAAARLEVEKAVVADASDGRALSLLAMIDAGLGRQEQAVQEAEHACDLEPFENFGQNAPVVRCNLAVVYAWNGQFDFAISELDQLVNRPAGTNLPAQPTYGDFLRNPLWDPLRNDPRFTAIMKRLAPSAFR